MIQYTQERRWVMQMAGRRAAWNQTRYEAYLKSGRGRGRGQGEGVDYLPWISIHDFSSKGLSSRVYGHKSRRIHHFLSWNELYFFYILEWSDKVLDIREQFPLLDMELAIDVAQRAGVKYPRNNASGFPYLLTCDFMITTENGLKARTIKSISDLKNKRTLEKLEIERRYWNELGIDCYWTRNWLSKSKAYWMASYCGYVTRNPFRLWISQSHIN